MHRTGLAYPPLVPTGPPACLAGRRRSARPEPRLGGRARGVQHDIGVRISLSSRSLLDRVESQSHLGSAEVARLLLASGFYLGHSLRTRVATALCANSVMHAFAATSRIVGALHAEFAHLSAAATGARTSPSPPTEPIERGPGDATLLRLKLDQMLHRRLRTLVEVFVCFRRDGEMPQGDDATARRLVQYLAARSPSDIARERSPIAEVVRWALAQAEPDADELVVAFMKGRAVIWKRIDRAIDAMRAGLQSEMGVALAEVR